MPTTPTDHPTVQQPTMPPPGRFTGRIEGDNAENPVNFDTEAPSLGAAPDEDPDHVPIEAPGADEVDRPVREPQRGEPRVEDPSADPATSGE